MGGRSGVCIYRIGAGAGARAGGRDGRDGRGRGRAGRTGRARAGVSGSEKHIDFQLKFTWKVTISSAQACPGAAGIEKSIDFQSKFN